MSLSPAPTLLLMFLLLLPYELFIAGDRSGTSKLVRFARTGIVSVVLCVAVFIAAQTLFANRLHEITSGSDPSFFYRVHGPFLAAQQILGRYPIAGAGLTGDPFIEDDVLTAYIDSPSFSRSWHIAHPASELLINYFWLHWIYLGLLWGTLLICALSAWLRASGVKQVAFCWIVWAILVKPPALM